MLQTSSCTYCCLSNKMQLNLLGWVCYCRAAQTPIDGAGQKPTVEWRRSHPQACYIQGSVCTSAPLFLHSFGNTDSDHTAQIQCSGHHPCRLHSRCHHARQRRAAHVRQRELAAHTLALLHGVPAHANTIVAAHVDREALSQSQLSLPCLPQ